MSNRGLDVHSPSSLTLKKQHFKQINILQYTITTLISLPHKRRCHYFNFNFIKYIIVEQDLIDKLQHQVRMYKKQLEEAEDIAANNLAKYKVVMKVLVEAQERAGESELDLERKRGVSRGSSLARDF